MPTIALVILMGVFPGIFLRPMEPSVNRIIERVTGSQPARSGSTIVRARRLRSGQSSR